MEIDDVHAVLAALGETRDAQPLDAMAMACVHHETAIVAYTLIGLGDAPRSFTVEQFWRAWQERIADPEQWCGVVEADGAVAGTIHLTPLNGEPGVGRPHVPLPRTGTLGIGSRRAARRARLERSTVSSWSAARSSRCTTASTSEAIAGWHGTAQPIGVTAPRPAITPITF